MSEVSQGPPREPHPLDHNWKYKVDGYAVCEHCGGIENKVPSEVCPIMGLSFVYESLVRDADPGQSPAALLAERIWPMWQENCAIQVSDKDEFLISVVEMICGAHAGILAGWARAGVFKPIRVDDGPCPGLAAEPCEHGVAVGTDCSICNG